MNGRKIINISEKKLSREFVSKTPDTKAMFKETEWK